MNAGLMSGVSKDFSWSTFLHVPDTAAGGRRHGWSVRRKLAESLPAKGVIGLGYWELGFRNLTNNRHPVAKADDIAGLKIRVLQSPVFIDLFTALGANPVPMPYLELYTALETGTVDGQKTRTATSFPPRCSRCRST